MLLRSLGVKFLGFSNSQRSVHFLEPEDNIIPIYMKYGMFCIDIHKPTEHELLTCTNVNLTDDMPWNPEQVQTDKNAGVRHGPRRSSGKSTDIGKRPSPSSSGGEWRRKLGPEVDEAGLLSPVHRVAGVCRPTRSCDGAPCNQVRQQRVRGVIHRWEGRNRIPEGVRKQWC